MADWRGMRDRVTFRVTTDDAMRGPVVLVGSDSVTDVEAVSDRTGGRVLERRGLLPLCIVAILLCVGIGLRWVGLADRPLEESELLHYFVASSLNQGEGPVLPSGNVYSRGLEISRLIALSISRIEPAELAVRVPSALFGSLSLVLLAVIAWRIGGPWTAVGALALQALYPQELSWSRTGRFYTLQLMFGLAALYAGWRVFARSTEERGASDRIVHTWLWAVATFLFLAVATGIQIVTLSVAVGLAIAWAIAAMNDVHRLGRASVRRSVPVQCMILAVLAALIVLLAQPGLPTDIYAQARSVPFWAIQSTDVPGPLVYAYALGTRIPVAASLGPLAFVVVLARRPWLGVYLLTWFAVPFLIHSLLLPFRQERYILLAMPALFIALGITAAWALAALHRDIRATLLNRSGNVRLIRAAAAMVVGIAVLGGLAPMVASAAKLVKDDSRADSAHPAWSPVARIIADTPDIGSLPIGSGHPLPALHYLGRVSFSVRPGFLERPAGNEEFLRTGSAFRWEPDGASEYYAGVPVLASPESIRARFGPAGGVLIMLEEREISDRYTKQELRLALRNEAHELCQGRCGSLRLFHWPFGVPTEGQ